MSSKLSVDDVARVADLARLELSDSEKANLAHHLSDILVQFARLQDLDTSNVKPTAHSIPMSSVLRSDVVIPSLARDQAVMNAPEKRDGNFIVPQIVEQ
jgi:aspartyl-tRNA(Asn)/glutamyl-tRNA(Gln) amidotransferase subunit C